MSSLTMRLAAMTGLCLLPLQALATDYPLTVTDEAGRSVTIQKEPERIALQDGRDATMLALLDRADPFRRVVVWNNLLRKDDPTGWQILSGKWPAADKITDMGFGDNGDVNLEEILAARPDLMVVQARALKSLEQSGTLDRLKAQNIPVIAVDLFQHPVPDAVDSVDLLGKVLNRETEAKAYTDFYTAHLDALKAAIAKDGSHPKIFVEALAGRSGAEHCCFTHGTVGWGALVKELGAENIGSTLLSTPSGDVTLESVIAQKPDVYVFTGRNAGGASQLVPLGYEPDQKAIDAALDRFSERPGFGAVKAVADGQTYALWHFFYSHPYNIVALEWLAKWAYPKSFATLDPDQTWHEIITKFTDLPDAPIETAVKVSVKK